MLTGILYTGKYLLPYHKQKSPAELSLHYFSYLWLYLSMLAVLMFRDGLAFMIVWELMAVFSFILVLFEGEKRGTLKTAVNYLIQMHVGFVMILLAFLICYSATGDMSFDGLKLYFTHHNNMGLFLLFFTGFGIKAGFIPLHTWLPEAHPVAPSNVSGVMSGIMIKMGIYGIVRVLTNIQEDMYHIGIIILIISVISGLLGVMKAIIQHNLKRLLAFHSIENIGIIGIGIGIGMIGLGFNNPLLAMLGFAGGLLHVVNHSLFKSLLFFSAGSVYSKYHTNDIEQLGGVIHKMPKTAFLFLIGSLAICGLPPLNGFISEILIYTGLFKGLASATFYNAIIMMLAIISLVLIGGLAIFCFTKAFSIVFLGVPRVKRDEDISEVSFGMLIPQFMIVLMIFFIGLFPLVFVTPLTNLVASQFNISISQNILSLTDTLSKISIIGFILFAFIIILYYIRKIVLNKRTVKYDAVWGCGSLNTNERQQYTGTSFANNFKELAKPVLLTSKEYSPIHDNEIFPSERSFSTHSGDVFKSTVDNSTDFFMVILKTLARLQTGKIQHYILYAFIFMLLIFLLMYMNIL